MDEQPLNIWIGIKDYSKVKVYGFFLAAVVIKIQQTIDFARITC